MNLSDGLILLSLCFVVYAVGIHVWERTAPLRATNGGDSVKKKRTFKAFKPRLEGSNVQNVQNDMNAGSTHQDAGSNVQRVQRVQDSSTPPASPAGDAGQRDQGFTLTPRELAQLGEALHLRREGATVEECLSRAFGVSKGGSAGYQRAKALYDASTAVPGAAPAGTYTAPEAPVRRRRKTTRRA